MNLEQLCKDYRIDFATSEHHHVSDGWIGVNCPFCSGGRNYHCGINLQTLSVNCWRCGKHELSETLERLTSEKFNVLWARYRGAGQTARRAPKRKAPPKDEQKALELPSGFCVPLSRPHRRYLERRAFDPDHLVAEWGICSTGPVAKLGGKSYPNRIFIPIHHDGRLVSFQTRLTNPGPGMQKYDTCEAEIATADIRRILYRHPLAMSESGICVEGVTDVWRLGRYAFAVLGIGFSPAQASQIARRYKRVMVVFDPEPDAQRRAAQLVDLLVLCGVEAWRHTLPPGKDPGDLSRREADEVIQRLL